MFAQYTGITAGLSVVGAVFINMGLRDLGNLLPSFSTAQLSAILSGKFNRTLPPTAAY